MSSDSFKTDSDMEELMMDEFLETCSRQPLSNIMRESSQRPLRHLSSQQTKRLARLDTVSRKMKEEEAPEDYKIVTIDEIKDMAK